MAAVHAKPGCALPRLLAACCCALLPLTLPAGAQGTEGWVPVSDSALGETRGGFELGNGTLLSLGVERIVSINGAQVASSQFRIADLANITAGEALRLREAIEPLTVVQNGAGNTAMLGDTGRTVSALLIQNSANDQLIRSQTTIDAAVSTLPVLTGVNFESSMRSALAGVLTVR